MAVTVTANLTDITLGEAGDDTYWTGEDGNSTEVYRQGSASQSWIVGKNADETASFDAYSSNGSAVFDMSGTGDHLYITMRCDIAPYIDYVHIGLQSDTAHGSTTSGTTYWTIVDNTTNIEWYGEWYTFVLDINSSTTFSTTGTLDLSAITDVHVNVDNSTSGNIRSIENTYIDVIRYGTGLTMTGTAWDWDDVAGDDSGSTNKYDIIQKVGPGVYRVQGQLAIGNGATTTTPSTTNETLYFLDPSTAGASGGPLGKLASGFYTLIFQGSGLAGAFNNMSVLASTNTVFTIDADDTNLVTDAVVWDGGTVLGAGAIGFYTGSTYKNMTFTNSGIITPGGATMTTVAIKNATDANGGLLLPSSTTVLTYLSFTSDGTGHAYYATSTGNRTLTGWTYTGYAAQGGTSTDRVFYNNSGGAITLTIGGNGDTPTYLDGTSATTTINNDKTVTFTGMKNNSEVRVYQVSDDSVVDGIEDATTGTDDDRSFAWSAAAGLEVYYRIHCFETGDEIYETIYIPSYTVPNNDVSVTINQRIDRNAEN